MKDRDRVTFLTKVDTLKLTLGDYVYCTVEAVRGWYQVTGIRPRDGYIKVSGVNTWNPPHNFRLTKPGGEGWGNRGI